MQEVQIILDGAVKRIEREKLFVQMGAWETARLTMIGFHKPKDFPAFSKFVDVRGEPRRMAWQDIKANLMMTNIAAGGKVRKKE